MAGLEVQTDQETTVTAGEGAEIFNDYRQRTFGTDEGYEVVKPQAGNVASGIRAHAEGSCTTASGYSAHAEGSCTTASGSNSHAEGGCFTGSKGSAATAYAAHAEGCSTTASGAESHAEGASTKAEGVSSHAEGTNTVASEQNSHAEGYAGIAEGRASHVEGGMFSNGAASRAVGYAAHAEGASTTALGAESHAEGGNTKAEGDLSHAEGSGTIASGQASHAEGLNTTASGIRSHAEGSVTKALKEHCHAEGTYSTASGFASHAEGNTSKASGDTSHAEGERTEASGSISHAEGLQTIASGSESHAEGYSSKASGSYSHAANNGTIAAGYCQTAIGKYNVESETPNDILIIGFGNDASARSNCFRVTNYGVYGTGAFSASGADYAELFEWMDGNPDGEDRVGRFVTLDGEKIRIASPEDDFILGIVSGDPSVVGDVHDDQWQGMNLRDIFGRPAWEEVEVPEVTEEVEVPLFEAETEENAAAAPTFRKETRVTVPAHAEIRQKINPDYDNTRTYVPRTERLEWDAVGMMGKLVAVDDGTCQVNGWCSVSEGGAATASGERTRYRCMARLDETHIRVLIL